MLLISVEDDLKPLLTKAVSDVDDSTLLTSIVTWVSTEFERYCNRLFTKAERTKYFDAGSKYYVVNAFPIDALATLTVIYDSDEQTLASDYWVWYDEGVIEFQSTPSKTEPKQISITYTGGYESVDGVLAVPDDIKYACVLQSAFVYRRRKDIGLSSASMPDGSISVMSPTKLLPDVVSILNRHKSYSFR